MCSFAAALCTFAAAMWWFFGDYRVSPNFFVVLGLRLWLRLRLGCDNIPYFYIICGWNFVNPRLFSDYGSIWTLSCSFEYLWWDFAAAMCRVAAAMCKIV